MRYIDLTEAPLSPEAKELKAKRDNGTITPAETRKLNKALDAASKPRKTSGGKPDADKEAKKAASIEKNNKKRERDAAKRDKKKKASDRHKKDTDRMQSDASDFAAKRRQEVDALKAKNDNVDPLVKDYLSTVGAESFGDPKVSTDSIKKYAIKKYPNASEEDIDRIVNGPKVGDGTKGRKGVDLDFYGNNGNDGKSASDAKTKTDDGANRDNERSTRRPSMGRRSGDSAPNEPLSKMNDPWAGTDLEGIPKKTLDIIITKLKSASQKELSWLLDRMSS